LTFSVCVLANVLYQSLGLLTKPLKYANLHLDTDSRFLSIWNKWTIKLLLHSELYDFLLSTSPSNKSFEVELSTYMKEKLLFTEYIPAYLL